MLVAGTGVSMPFAAAPAAALGSVATADAGKASGANATFQRFGAAFGIAVATQVFTANGHLGSPAGFTTGMRPALLVAAALAALGAVGALGVSAVRQHAAPGPTGSATRVDDGGKIVRVDLY
jgi:hypothetical protein